MCRQPVLDSMIHVPDVAVNHWMTDNDGMSTPLSFGQWLRHTRMAHGLSQAALARKTGMSRTHIIATERNATWPRDETRDRLHDFFKTSDEDLVAAGVARRVVYEVPGRPPQVTYEPTVRRGDQVPVEVAPSLEGVPADVVKALGDVDWTDQNREIVLGILATLTRADALAARQTHPDRPAELPRDIPAPAAEAPALSPAPIPPES